jgi:DNA mismatch repair ATPase MutS
MPLVSYYTEQLNHYTEKLQSIRRRIILVATLRMISFIAAAFCIYGFIRNGGLLVTVFAILFILAFILLIKWNFRLNDEKDLLQKLVFVNDNELNVLSGQPNDFDDGERFLSDEGFANDIDVFGHRSLFHLVNRTTTTHGTDQLADSLQKPMHGKPDIENYQQAIKILSQQTALRQLVTAHGLLHDEKEGNLHQIGDWLRTKNQLHNSKWVGVIRLLLPVCNIAALLYYWSTDNYIPLGSTIVLSWLCIARFGTYISTQHALLGKKQAILDQYASILKIFSGIQTGSSSLLQDLQRDASKAFASIQKLSKLSGLLDQRMNLVVNAFLNSLLVYDLQCLYALEEWKLRNKAFFDKWIQCVGSIESLNSLATFAYNNPGFCTPVVIEKDLVIEATALAHPLIPANERVPNDIELGRNSKLALVTGSNMSGKTTFLRTIGINLLLAQCGAPVCATAFSFTPMYLLTAIRISDSLQLHTSYFMAELKRLQNIIKYLESGKPALVLVDEILRGTNSDDKSHGSEEFIKKIISFNCLTLFATHDLSLSIMEKNHPGVISNYCFESTIVNEELYFDYRLQPGIAKNKNASFLMKKMDII